MRWISFFHFYQPANADAYHIKEAADHSYSRLLRAMEEHPHFKATANFSGCLLARLDELGYGWMIERFRKVIESGRLEIVGSAAYHGFLPLLPKLEVEAQVKENEQLLEHYFGIRRPDGFFFPEMAYSPEAAKIIKKLGYRYIILDEIAYDGKLDDGRGLWQRAYIDKNSGLEVALRPREFSNCYAPDKIGSALKKGETLPENIISAGDAEVYGLRHKDQTGNLEKFLKLDDSYSSMTVSEFLSLFPDKQLNRFVNCSWESAPKELAAKKPYMLWHDPKNNIHKHLWQLALLACHIVSVNKKDPNHSWARWHLVRGLASCTFWWASGRDLSHNFGPQAWSPDEIERGVNELIRCIRSLENPKTRPDKIGAEKLYLKIKRLIWQKHWHYHWQR
jgi:predicted glycosyl hydrolase (DUF1957 family)